MKCIISGGSGFIGRKLVDSLLKDDHYVSVWSRNPGEETRSAVGSFYWDTVGGEPAEESLNDFDAVIHLAGEPVAQRWSDEVKKRIRDTRVLGTRHLVSALGKVRHRPSILVCASAVGYYGDRGEEILTEQSGQGRGFLADVCREWEQEADGAAVLGMRVVKIRISVVLGKDGGALKQMLPPFRAGVGGKLGSGKQWMPWIHVNDLVGLLRFALEHEIAGVFNGASPEPVTNAKFTEAMSGVLHRPAIFPVPGLALKLLFGEMAQVMLSSERVLPKAAEAAGFKFTFPEIRAALRDVVG